MNWNDGSEDYNKIARLRKERVALRALFRRLHRYTITSEGAGKGYFRLVEDPQGAWLQWPELEAALVAIEKEIG